MGSLEKIRKIAVHFLFDGEFIHAEPFGQGHINDTYVVYYRTDLYSTRRYIIQRINHLVFKKPHEVMENIANVTEHIREKVVAAGGDVLREVMTIVRTTGGESCYVDREGNYYRAYVFVDDATAYQTPEKPEYFYESARLFGRFQRMLVDFPAEKLFSVIPDFHNTRKRVEVFEDAVKNDMCRRAAGVQAEIAFALERRKQMGVLVELLEAGELPLRVTHNDTKLNNVMIDNKTGKGICVVDLDTVMPGLSLYDYGDSIRFGASTAAEDEIDLEKVWVDLALFESFTKGFLEEAGGSLLPSEISHLFDGARIMTFECGIRFLTDYLNGDTYFKTHRDGHNLDRCRTQFKLVADMEKKESVMREIVEKCSKL